MRRSRLWDKYFVKMKEVWCYGLKKMSEEGVFIPRPGKRTVAPNKVEEIRETA